MGSPYYNNADRPPYPYYPPQPVPNYVYPPYSPHWPNNYQATQPQSTPFQGQSYYDRMYRPVQVEFQRQAPLAGRVSEFVPPIYSPSLWSDGSKNKTGTRLLFETLHRPPLKPLPGFDQEYILDASQTSGPESASSYSSTVPSNSQNKGTLSTFLKEKCGAKKTFEPTKKFVDLATMVQEFDQIYTLSHTISRDYIKKIARLRCSEKGRQDYKGSILEYNFGDTLFNIFARVVNEADDFNYRDQLKRNMEMIANLMDLLAKDNDSDSPIFHACSKETFEQDEKFARQKKSFHETGGSSGRNNATNPRLEDQSRKRKIDSLVILDEKNPPTRNNYIQNFEDDQQTPLDRQLQPKRVCLKWVDTKFTDEENRAPSELNQSNFNRANRPPSPHRKKGLGNPEAPSREKPPEETRRSHQRRRQTATVTSQGEAKSIPIDLSNEGEEKKIGQQHSKGGISVKILSEGKTAKSSSRLLTQNVELQSEKTKSAGETNSLICQESLDRSPLFVPCESDVSEKSQKTSPMTHLFANTSDSIQNEIKIPTAIRLHPPTPIVIKAPSRSQPSLDVGEISSDSFVDRIFREEEGSQRQLPPLKLN